MYTFRCLKKINIQGNTSFALYPGQMAKVIQGHRLHRNQYLLARVYDADVLSTTEILNENGEPTGEVANKYVTGQLLIIKGTEVSFYISFFLLSLFNKPQCY